MVTAKKLILQIVDLGDSVNTQVICGLEKWEKENTPHLERLRCYDEDRGGVFDKIWDHELKFFQA